MISSTQLSVGIARADFVGGYRGMVGSREDSHLFPGPHALAIQVCETLHHLPPYLEEVL